MNNKLYALVNELNFKKDTLDTKTNTIVEGIKSWCIEENNRIDKEFEELVNFINKNLNLFKQNTTIHCYSDDTYYREWGGLSIAGKLNNKCELCNNVGLTDDWKYRRNFGFSWTKLPKPMKYSEYRFFDKTDMNITDVTYWTDYKRCLAIRNEYLEEVVKNINNYLEELIGEEDKRFNEMNKACKEIVEDNTKTIEIKVKVRV